MDDDLYGESLEIWNLMLVKMQISRGNVLQLFEAQLFFSWYARIWLVAYFALLHTTALYFRMDEHSTECPHPTWAANQLCNLGQVTSSFQSAGFSQVTGDKIWYPEWPTASLRPGAEKSCLSTKVQPGVLPTGPCPHKTQQWWWNWPYRPYSFTEFCYNHFYLNSLSSIYIQRTVSENN